MATWRHLIEKAAEGDTIIACTLTDEELDMDLFDGYGAIRGKDFTAWSERYVYFPVECDWGEEVGRVPRHPCDEAARI